MAVTTVTKTEEFDRARPDPKRRSPRIALFAVFGVILAAGAGAGGYFLGDSTGEDLDAARKAGASAGATQGTAAGREAGLAEGFEQGRKAAYDEAYATAYQAGYRTSYTDAGQQPPAEPDVPVPGQ